MNGAPVILAFKLRFQSCPQPHQDYREDFLFVIIVSVLVNHVLLKNFTKNRCARRVCISSRSGRVLKIGI